MKSGYEEVLIVIEQDIARVRMSTLLQQLGYRATAAATAPEAIKILSEGNRPDILLSDIVMHTLNGPALADEARRSLPSLKVVYRAAHAAKASFHNGALDPAVHILASDITAAELAAVMRRALED